MAKRCNMAIEYGWPKKVIIKRFQDRVYKMLSEKPWLIDTYPFCTPLHSPDVCVIRVEVANTSLINHIIEAKLGLFVSPDTEWAVKVFMIWPK